MSTCSTIQAIKIRNSLEEYFEIWNPTKDTFQLADLEKSIASDSKINNFKLKDYLIVPEINTTVINLFNAHLFSEVADIIPATSDESLHTKSNVVKDFSSNTIVDLFHALPLAKLKFEQDINGELIKEILIGDPSISTYVKNNGELTNNFNKVKNNKFRQIQEFLKGKGKLLGEVDNLYDENGNIKNYTYYKTIMTTLSDYFFRGNFEMMESYSGKKIPNINLDLVEDKDIYDAYNNGILLSNFDSVINIYFKGLVDVNFNYFNNLLSNVGTNDKYTLKIEGIKTAYWKSDDHASEGSENMEDKLTKLLISSIPSFNKKGLKTQSYLEMKDFYLFAAQLSNFELLHGNELRNTQDSTFKYFNITSGETLIWYLNNIIDAVQNKPGSIEALKNHFQANINFIYSLKNFLESPEYNIATKEKNSKISVVSILTQAINNNFGASYIKYNAEGKYVIQEMYKQDFNNIQLNNTVLSKLLGNFNKVNFYNLEESQEKGKVNEEKVKFDSLFTGLEDTSLAINIPRKVKADIGSYIKSKTGIFIHYIAFNDIIRDLEKESSTDEQMTVVKLKNNLIGMMSALNQDFGKAEFKNAVKDGIINNASKGDVTAGDYLKATVSDTTFKAITNAYLINFIMKPLMNVETLTGEKLPTFKTATLTYKDTELFELQRNFEQNNPEGKFKSSLLGTDATTIVNGKSINTGVILGTGTRLEATNKDKNKSAFKFSVSESYMADFQFDFLRNIVKNKAFSIMIGNYADKNTVLTKIISANHRWGKDKEPVITKNIDEILELVRSQGRDYYYDTLYKVFTDYSVILNALGEKNSIDLVNFEKSFDSNVKEINRILSKNNSRDLIERYINKVGNTNNVSLTEELHYSKYGNITSLNQLLVDNFRIFSDSNKNGLFFGKEGFVMMQEANLVSKFREFNKNLPKGPDNLNFVPNIKEEDIQEYLKVLNIDQEPVVKKVGRKSKEQIKEENKDYTSLLINEKLNPLVRKWQWLNALYRNEYLFISAKGEYMHPHKIKGFEYRGDSEKINWEQYTKESSGRLISMAKRNVLFTATIESPVRNSQLGVPDEINQAVIDDHKADLFNYTGERKSNQDAHDGSSYIDYVYSLMIDASYPGKGYSGTKKQFGTYITPNGVAIKKDAESIISNDKILNSKNSSVKFLNNKKQMLGINIGTLNMSTTKTFNNQYFYIENGINYSIRQLEIKDNMYIMHLSKKVNGNWKAIGEPKRGQFNTLFDLWQAFGGQYSTDKEGNFNEGSNELLYEVVTTPDAQGKFPLKSKIIHIISNISGVKAGATNVNSKEYWTKDKGNKLAYTTYDSRFMGPQLDATHESDQSQIKEVTQVISALSQNGNTAHLAREAYQDIANVIKKSTEKYAKYMTPALNSNGEMAINTEELYKYLSDKFIQTVENSKGDNIAKVLVQAFSKDVRIPFSNQNFFVSFVRDIITRMNNEFITRYYSGTGAILIPSHGIIQLYDISLEDGTYRTVTQADLAKEAIKKYIPKEGIIESNDTIIDNYINNLLQLTKVTWDKIQLGDTILTTQEVEDYNEIEHALIADDINIKENTKAWRNDPTKINKTYEFSLINKPKEIFELVKDLEDNYYSIHFKTTGKDSLTEIEKERLIGNIHSFLPPGAKISTWGDVTKGGLAGLKRFLNTGMVESGETRVANLEGSPIELPVYKFPTKLIEIPITLSNPELYYQYKLGATDLEVFKVNNVPRDLKPSNISFNIGATSYNIFDLDSIRLRYSLESSKYFNSTDEILLQKFAEYLGIDLSTIEGRHLVKIGLNKWTQRSLSLLDDGRIMPPIVTPLLIDFNTYFGGDKFEEIYSDVRNHYLNSSITVENYKFDSAELILGDIYQSNFRRGDHDSLYEIKTKGFSYFSEVIKRDYSNDDTKADIKLNVSNSEEPIFIRYVDELPGFDKTINLKTRSFVGDNGETTYKYVRYNQKGEELYTLPNTTNIRVINEKGKEIILIKAAVKNVINRKEVWDKVSIFNSSLSELLKSFKGNIKSFIPLMNGKLSGKLNSIKVNKETGKQEATTLMLSSTTMFEFSTFTGYTRIDDAPLDAWWISNNKDNIAEQLGKKMYASWEKSHEFIAARIPSQSMQSFMAMKNVAYFNTKSNDAYVSIWQIWLQGSDFDIDKSYILGSGFDKNGQFDSWSNMSGYSTIEQLNMLESLPIPSGIEVKEGQGGIDITPDFALFSESIKKSNISYEYSADTLKILNRVIRKINNIEPIEGSRLISIHPKLVEANFRTKEIFLQAINKHNTYTGYTRTNNAVKNSVVARIKKIITSPSNQIIANVPVDVEPWQEAAKKALAKSSKKPILLSPYDLFSHYKQQRDAAVGKDDVGIAANGLKVTFALASHYNEYYANELPKNVVEGEKLIETLRRDSHTFKKNFVFVDSDGISHTFDLATLSDTQISKTQKQLLANAVGEFMHLNSESAISLSSFTSAATDNAKELLMAKVNANVELASMHIYLLALGFTPDQIAEIMTNEVIEDVIDKLETNIFFTTEPTKVPVILSKLYEQYKEIYADVNHPKMVNLKMMRDVYQGAQEFKLLSSLLGVNQKTSANTEEMNKYLSNFESIMLARENSVFGESISMLKSMKFLENSKALKNKEDAEKNWNKIFKHIFDHNKQLNPDLDKEYVRDIITRASNVKVTFTNELGVRETRTVSLVGGTFDFRYFTDVENDNYKQLAKEYYNIIKNTINIFDVIDTVPHFKAMISGLVLSHNMLINSSMKYNTAFNILKDVVKENYHRIVFRKIEGEKTNPHINNIMGNYNFSVQIGNTEISKMLLGIDIFLKDTWLKTEEAKTLSFNVKDLMRMANVKEISLYTSDEARVVEPNSVSPFTTIIKIEDDTDPVVTLDTNFGIANFKKITEELLLPIMQAGENNVLLDSLKVESVRNLFGIRGNAITSTFSLGELNNAISVDKFQKLLMAFNNLDVNSPIRGKLKNTNGKEVKWRDALYVYNLLINNEKYGNKRLTPLFQDYIKEPKSLGYKFVTFSSKLDSGELNLFDYTRNILDSGQTPEEMEIAEETAKKEMINDILFYAFNAKGELSVKDQGKNKVLSITNPDFVVVTSITETEENKKYKQEFQKLLRLIRNGGYIIKFKC